MGWLSMDRRRFLAALSAVSLWRNRASAAPRPALGPLDSVLKHVEPGSDEFPGEKKAAEIVSHLGSLIRERKLPLARSFRGASPMPARYRDMGRGISVAEFSANNPDFDKGLAEWIASLGEVVDSRFFVLPGDLIRYEIKSRGAYRTGVWKQQWEDGKLVSFTPVSEERAVMEPWFRDVTGYCFGATQSFPQQLRRGVPYWRSRLDLASGIDIYGNNGIAVGDIDGDGWDEVYVCQPGGLPNRLYKNRGNGIFDDITPDDIAILDDTACALFVDFRNSGRQDLVVLRASGPLLFFNEEKGRFRHVPDAFRFASTPAGTFTGMSAADYDRDGRVDLYIASYIYFQSEDQYRYPTPYHDAQNGPPNFLFRNELTGTGGIFRDVTAESGISHNNNRYSFAPAWCDYNNDGWPDLYVANDFGRNNLYRNAQGRFQDVAAEAGVEDTGPGMSAAWFDYDHDGRTDLYVANMWTDAGQRIAREGDLKPEDVYRRHTKGNSLYRNRGDGTFEERGAQEHAEMGRWAWSSDARDFDNDRTPEVLVACGMLTNRGLAELNSFFWRQVVARSPQTAKPAPEYEAGWNAINQLIREDANWCGHEPNVFYARRRGRFWDISGVSGLDYADDGRAFAFTDLDGDGRLDILLKNRLGPQLRAMRNSCGIERHAIAFRLHGVKSNRDAIGAKVRVDGTIQHVQAGSGYLSQHTKILYFGLADSLQAREVTIEWPSGTMQRFNNLAAELLWDITEDSQEAKQTPFLDRITMPESPVEGDNSMETEPTWLLEPVPLPEKLPGPGYLCLTEGQPVQAPGGIPLTVINLAQEKEDRRAVYSLFRRYLFDWRTELTLPFTMLLDERGAVRKIYPGIPSDEVLRADWKGESKPLPFPGRYYQPPGRSYFKLGAAFYWGGYPSHALQYIDEVVRRQPGNYQAWLASGQIELELDRPRQALPKLQRALELRPEATAPLTPAARAHLSLGEFAEAEKLLRKALERDESDADAANQLGLACARQNRNGEARQWFQQAIRVRRGHSGAINNLGVLYMQMRQPNDAISAFQYGLEVAPDDDELYFNLGRVYVTMGEREKAREVMRRLLERKPDHASARRAMEELDRR